MKKEKKSAGLLGLLTLTLWFALSCGTVFAAEQPAHAPADGQVITAAPDHAAVDAGAPAHGEAAGHVAPNSL